VFFLEQYIATCALHLHSGRGVGDIRGLNAAPREFDVASQGDAGGCPTEEKPNRDPQFAR
jgi:hypothetical protein